MVISPVPRMEPLTGFVPWTDAVYDRELYPALTLHQFGFYINTFAERDYALLQWDYVKLYWDPKTRRMSAKFYPKGDFPCARKARFIAKGRGRRVSCAPFFKECGITADDYGKYPCTDDSGVGLLVIQLKKLPRQDSAYNQLA